MILRVGLLLAGAVALVQGQEDYSFRTPDRTIVARNVSDIKVHFEPTTGDFDLTGTGTPATVLAKAQGLQFSGQSVAFKASPAAAAKGLPTGNSSYFLTQGDASGSAEVRFSSDIFYDLMAEQRKEAGQPVPPKGDTFFLATVRSESVHYVGNATEGTVTTPTALSVDVSQRDVVQTTRNKVAGTESFQTSGFLRGSSGTFSFFLHHNGAASIQKGTLAGPVALELHRKATFNGVAEMPDDLVAHADSLTVDFTGGQRVVRLLGNVTLEGNSASYAGTAKFDEAVLKLNEQMIVTDLTMTGKPAVTRIRSAGGGGGR